SRVTSLSEHRDRTKPDGCVPALLLEPHGINWRQRLRHAGPAVALVLTHPKAPCRRAEGGPVAGRPERAGVAVDDIVGVRLRQPLGQDVEALAAIARARDHQLAIAGNTLLILDFRDKPRGIGLTWMDDNRKAESRWLDTVDLGKGPSFIGGDEDSVVVLHTHAFRRSRAVLQSMDSIG